MALNAGLTAGFQTFRRVHNHPEGFLHRTHFTSWDERYALNWSYYIGSALEELTRWAAYRNHHRLYRFTRNIHNPTRRLVDFYAGTIYPGVLTADARRFEDGTVIAIPFAEDTPQNLTQAISKLWKWSNWHIAKNTMIRFASTTGECLVEIIDDPAGGKVEFQVRYPALVKNLELDFQGNVKGYSIEYEYEEKDPVTGGLTGRTYKYRKTVDPNSVRTYRDDALYSYEGVPAVMPNVYGFVPAVWVKHTDVGTDHGEPCMRYMGKWDELNSLASHTLDQMHRILEAPLLVTGDNIQSLKEELPEGAQESATRPDAGRGNIPILRGPAGSRIESAQLHAGEAFLQIDRMLEEIEKDHPELTLWREARKMSQVTGPSVGRLFGDVEILVREARNNYDTQSVKLFQMAVAIGGMRANAGDWGEELSNDQEAFLPFDLNSYARGDLDMEIQERPLIHLGRWEVVQTRRAEVALEREEIMLAQTRANPLGAGEPSGDMANQIAQRLRLRSSTEGAQQVNSAPTG